MNFKEEWIAKKLKERLLKYQNKYPNFDVEAFMEYISDESLKMQRWSPYMEDKDIKMINKWRRFSKGMSRIGRDD